jgi:hypothetical protein
LLRFARNDVDMISDTTSSSRRDAPEALMKLPPKEGVGTPDVSAPGRADTTSANLTPASGCQDHTTSPYAATSLVRSLLDRSQAEAHPAIPSRARRCRVHRIPPRVRDDRDTPLWWGGIRKVLDLIWGEWEQKYFSEKQK